MTVLVLLSVGTAVGVRVTIWNGDSREEVTVTCIILYLLHRERIIICEKAYTRMPKVAIKSIVHSEASFTAFGLEKLFQYNILRFTAVCVTYDLIRPMWEYTGIAYNNTLIYVQQSVLKINVVPCDTDYFRTSESEHHSEDNRCLYI